MHFVSPLEFDGGVALVTDFIEQIGDRIPPHSSRKNMEREIEMQHIYKSCDRHCQRDSNFSPQFA
ncbi:MAG: hypothetical protein IGS49_23280 [Chlorogloeopsis fritschii C42_A2020_084]|uniref:hypothetical protein n=1 Tax=Chlorogloeopsis fritschii TaxID=1124 RepID=UPI0019E84BDD|nr:hypothetical protein [Chlorogloeopsis fritschii]MBF2008285.1 hypothetical protein [Chlorogloeopsis fritschii C42_A2020_084]